MNSDIDRQMSTRGFDQEIEVRPGIDWVELCICVSIIQETLSKERQLLLDKLTKIFDPEIAHDYVCPKTNETRQQLTIDELRHRM